MISATASRGTTSKTAEGLVFPPRTTRPALRTLACLCALWVCALALHQAVHATYDAVHPDAAPCALCHASRASLAFPFEAQRAVVFQQVDRAPAVLPATIPASQVQLLPFSRPPPALLCS